MLSPILTVMVKSARCNSLLRHYLKSKVLPPLRDVRSRPEIGDDLKNQLVRLLTTPATQVRDLVADFLFVLCKENGKDPSFAHTLHDCRFRVNLVMISSVVERIFSWPHD